MAATVKIENEGSEEFETFIAEGNFATLKVESKDREGDVEVCMEEDDDKRTIFLNQKGLKDFIAFLNKQIIPTHKICEKCGEVVDVNSECAGDRPDCQNSL